MCQLTDANPGLKGHRSLCILWQGPALIKVKIKVPSSLMASILVQLLLCDAISKINICCSSSCHSNYPGCGTLIYQYRPFVCNYVYSHVFPHDESKMIEARVEALWSAISFRSVRSEVSLCSCLTRTWQMFLRASILNLRVQMGRMLGSIALGHTLYGFYSEVR